MYTQFISAVAVVVSVLGLVSCNSQSQDRSDPAPIPDTWKLSPPTAHLTSSSDGQLSFPLAERHNPPLPADTVLEFNELANANFASQTEPLGVSFDEVDSTCHSGPITHSISFQLPRVRFLPISRLIPREFFRLIQRDDSQPISCNWNFRASNSLKSTHSFGLTEVLITDLWRLESLQWVEGQESPASLLKKQISPLIIATEDLNQHKTFKQYRFTSGDESESNQSSTPPETYAETYVELLCENFVNQRQIKSSASLEPLIRELFHGEIQEDSASQRKKLDPRLAQDQQNCRIVMQTRDKATGLTYIVALSPQLEVHFPLPAAQVKAQLLMTEYAYSFPFKQKVFELTIENPHDVPIAMRFPRELNIHVTPIYYLPSSGARQRPGFITFPLQIEFDNSVSLTAVDRDMLIEIPPHGTTWIRAGFEHKGGVGLAYLIDAGVQHGIPALIGYLYAYDRALELRQYRNGNVTGKLGAEVVSHPLPKAPAMDTPETGWIPLTSWTAYSGDGHLPQPITVVNTSSPVDSWVFCEGPNTGSGLFNCNEKTH